MLKNVRQQRISILNWLAAQGRHRSPFFSVPDFNPLGHSFLVDVSDFLRSKPLKYL